MKYVIHNADGSKGYIESANEVSITATSDGGIFISGNIAAPVTVSGVFFGPGQIGRLERIDGWQRFTVDYSRPPPGERLCQTKGGGVAICRYAPRRLVWLSLDGKPVDVIFWQRGE